MRFIENWNGTILLLHASLSEGSTRLLKLLMILVAHQFFTSFCSVNPLVNLCKECQLLKRLYSAWFRWVSNLHQFLRCPEKSSKKKVLLFLKFLVFFDASVLHVISFPLNRELCLPSVKHDVPFTYQACINFQVKHQEVARFLGGRLYDCVFKYTEVILS